MKNPYRIFDRLEKQFVPGVKFKKAVDANKYCKVMQAMTVEPVKKGHLPLHSSERRYTYTQLSLEQRVANEQYAKMAYRYR